MLDRDRKIETVFKDKQIERNEGSDKAEKIIYLNLGAQCNQDCVFCLIKGSEGNFPYMPIDEAKRIVREFGERGGEDIMITGGEPTIYPKLPELIQYIQGVEPIKRCSIITNGVRLADRNLVESLAQADSKKKLSFSVSIHSHIGEIADSITKGQSGDFEKTVSGIDNLLDFGYRISLYQVIQSDNYRLLIDFAKWAEKRFPTIRNMSLALPLPQGNANKNSEWLYPKLSELRPFLTETLKFLTDRDYKINIAVCGQFPLCVMPGFEEMVINPLLFYQRNVAGTVGTKVFHETEWSSKNWIESHKNKPSLCRECILNGICQGFWNQYVEVHGFDGALPVTFDNFRGQVLRINLDDKDNVMKVVNEIDGNKLNVIIPYGDFKNIGILEEAIMKTRKLALVLGSENEIMGVGNI